MGLGDRPLLLTVLSGGFVAVGIWLIALDRVVIGAVNVVFFGGCMLVGLGALVDRSRERRRARGEHVPEGSITPWLMTLASATLALGCGAMAWAVAVGALEPDRELGYGIVPIGIAGAVFFGVGAVLQLVRLMRAGRGS